MVKATVVLDGGADLLARAKTGDRRALGKLLKRHEMVVWRVCKALVPPGEDLDGAVQEVLLRSIKNIQSFRGDGDFGAWLARIATNYCRDLWRKRQQGITISLTGTDEEEEEKGLLTTLPAMGPDPDRELRVRQGWERLLTRLTALPERQREVFTLRFFAQLGVVEIASVLNVDVGTVKTHLHRAVGALRQEVREAWP